MDPQAQSRDTMSQSASRLLHFCPFTMRGLTFILNSMPLTTLQNGSSDGGCSYIDCNCVAISCFAPETQQL